MIKKPTHFVVVDDDAINNKMCKFSIKRHFNSPSIATYTNPEAALSMIQKEYIGTHEKPTVLFLDINMPAMDAWEFLDEFSALPLTVREQFAIFILSASSYKSDKDRALIHPLVSGYITKPLLGKVMDKLFTSIETIT